MLVIGIIGKKESGKTTISNMLGQCLGKKIKELAFGDSLKEMLILANMVTPEEVFLKKTKFSRWLMQKVGTNILREQIDPNFLVNKMRIKLDAIQKENPNAIVIVHDVRFLNEAKLITDMKGILIRITRPIPKWKQLFHWFFKKDLHRSETEQDQIETSNVILNEGSLEDLWNLAQKTSNFLLLKYGEMRVAQNGARYINQEMFKPYEKS
jgi:dephospho-CoA kinase